MKENDRIGPENDILDQMETNETQMVVTMPNTESLAKLENMESGLQLTAKYKTVEDWQEIKDKPIRCYFMGMKDIPNDQGEAIKCALFWGSDEVFLAAQMVLISAVNQLPEKTPVEITYLGKKSNKNSEGSTNLFNVTILK